MRRTAARWVRWVQGAQFFALGMAFLSIAFLAFGGAPAWKVVVKVSVVFGVIVTVFLLVVGAMGLGVVEKTSDDTNTKR